MEKSKGLTSELGSGKQYGSAAPAEQSVPAVSDVEKLKEKFEGFKKAILKKYPFTISLGLLPGQAAPLFEEDEQLPKEVVEKKPLHVLMLIPEDQYKDVPKIKPDVVKLLKEAEENSWLHIMTPVDLWNYGLDSRYEHVDALAASFPLHDKGFLGALRVASIHKTLVLRKFEKYVASYVIGGSLVRGTAGKDSDVDTFVVIDDTDVKRMNRIELLEKLRGIIFDYIREATALAGVKNILNVQVYLLTDFWQSVKDAHPVMFTFIRDGVPLHDRGTFIPWKLLLKMGKIKPSPEAVDMFMKSGEQTDAIVKRRLIDAMIDIYWGMVTPTQALQMLAGEAPSAPKTIVDDVKRLFVEKEKLLSSNEVKKLARIFGLYKDHEHGKLQSITGKEVDELMKDSEGYVKAMKELRGQLETRLKEHLADKLYDDTIALLKQLFGNQSADVLVSEVEKKLIKTGKLHPRFSAILGEVMNLRKKSANKKLSQSDVQRVSRDATDLIGALIEYQQRKDLALMGRGIMQIRAGDSVFDIVLTDAGVFVAGASGVRKIVGEALVESSKVDLEKALEGTKDRMKLSLSADVLSILKKELGSFSLVF